MVTGSSPRIIDGIRSKTKHWMKAGHAGRALPPSINLCSEGPYHSENCSHRPVWHTIFVHAPILLQRKRAELHEFCASDDAFDLFFQEMSFKMYTLIAINASNSPSFHKIFVFLSKQFTRCEYCPYKHKLTQQIKIRRVNVSWIPDELDRLDILDYLSLSIKNE